VIRRRPLPPGPIVRMPLGRTRGILRTATQLNTKGRLSAMACADLDLPLGRRDSGTRAVRGFQVQVSGRFSTAIGLLIAACLIALAVPSLARAGTAQLQDPDPGGAHLTFTATSGETNHLYLLFAPGGYRVIDLGAAITAGAGCSSVSSS
jgi:hypothetical protein